MKTGIKNDSGFTLTEVLVVMGIVALGLGMAAAFGLSDYHAYDFRAERNLAVSILQKARAQSMSNINDKPHGVFIDTANNQYVIFEPDPNPIFLPSGYNLSAGSNEYINFLNSSISHTDMTYVVFSPIDGQTTFDVDHLSLDGIKSVIYVNSEGQIRWTN